MINEQKIHCEYQLVLTKVYQYCFNLFYMQKDGVNEMTLMSIQT